MSNNNNQLTEDQKKQQAAVPAATPTASGSDSPYANYLTQNAKAPVVSAGGDEYSKWLETLAKNKKIENTPQNAKTYTDYLVYTGQDPVGDYQAKVRQADLEYRKSLATFGQNAEKMAQAGMTGSGYSDYLTGQAYAQRQGTVQAAQRDANAQMKQSFANYGEYVAGLQAEEAQSKTVDNVELTNALNSVSTMMGNGASIDAAIAGLKGVYSDAVLAQVKQNYQGQSGQQNTDIINSATGVSNYKAGLDQQLATGAITPDAYNQQLQAGYNKNYEFVTKALLGDNSGLAEYAKAAGIDISGGIADPNTGKAEVIDHMAQSGAITNAQRNQYYTTRELQSIQTTELTSKTAVNEVKTIQDMVDNGQITGEQQKELLSALGARVAQLFGNVEMTKIDWGWTSSSGTKHATNITYKQGDYGKEKIDITFNRSVGDEAHGEFREIFTNPNGKDEVMAFGLVNGKLAIKDKDGRCFYASYSNTKHNAAFVAWALTQGA